VRSEVDSPGGGPDGKAAQTLAMKFGVELAEESAGPGVGVRDAGIAAAQRGPVAEIPFDRRGARRGSTTEPEQRGERDRVSWFASPVIPKGTLVHARRPGDGQSGQTIGSDATLRVKSHARRAHDGQKDHEEDDWTHGRRDVTEVRAGLFRTLTVSASVPLVQRRHFASLVVGTA
jgi:hypothetical protein